MPRNNSAKLKINFKAKITLIILGLFLFLVFLEAGLRLGGFILLSMQEYRNRQTLKQKCAYRIMCLGESTTVGQYPIFLQEVLNQRNMGIRFSVIDKGIDGVTTAAILGQLNSNLNNYHPDMVVTMMGINDCGEHIPYEVATTSKIMLLFKSFRTYKLARLLWLHILIKAKEIGVYNPGEDKQLSEKIQTYLPRIGLKEASESISTEDSLKKALELNPKNDGAYLELGRLYRNQGKFSQAEEALKKATELNPENDAVYFELGRLYRNQGKFSQAKDSLKKPIELNPENDDAHFTLGRSYRDYDKFSQAEDSLKKALELNPKNDAVYFELGCLYREQGKFSQAEEALKKALKLNPKNGKACFSLGWLYQNQSKSLQAEDIFRKTIELNPGNDDLYLELGCLYREQGKFSQAEETLKKAIELNPKNDGAYGAILILYEKMGKPGLAKEYAKKANAVRLGYYNPITTNNYRKLKEILDKGGGIRLVCVQYPMRSIGPLKRIFKGNEEGIIFVDNERIFRDAVKKDGSRAYFTDMFGGDFGHCTEKGNRLLAENIANAILREVFGNLTQ